ncbi:hypothetical protein L3X38_039685 [Prunus dulcis]|uniref:Uncharacterized protein n=1 Tax=Prunus dulcis TaxID=3755 RepID=A0AAD4V941_PRUDU|nr:hypothetical protein L3X38_039685 [Prunus dulcis]
MIFKLISLKRLINLGKVMLAKVVLRARLGMTICVREDDDSVFSIVDSQTFLHNTNGSIGDWAIDVNTLHGDGSRQFYNTKLKLRIKVKNPDQYVSNSKRHINSAMPLTSTKSSGADASDHIEESGQIIHTLTVDNSDLGSSDEVCQTYLLMLYH